MQLDELKSLGGIADSYKELTLTGAVSVDQLLAMTEEEKASFDGVVALANYEWVATVQRKPAEIAKNVYSSAGDLFGNWKRDERIFYIMQLIDNRLTTIRQIKLPEKIIRGGLQMDLSKLGIGGADFAKELESFNVDSVANVEVAPVAEAKTDKDVAVNAIKQKLGSESLASREDIILNNQKHGRALGFIVKQNPTVKIAVKKVAKLDAQGKKILIATAEDDVRERYAKENKVPARYVETELSLVPTHAKPSKPVAMMISTPAGSDMSLTKLTAATTLQASDNNDMQLHIVSMEAAYSYLAANYDGRIKEDDTILGAKATWLLQQCKPVLKTAKDGSQEYLVTSSIVVEKNDSRKALLVDGNYFPLKVYDTISQQDMSPEDAASANLNIEAAMKKKDFDSLSDATKAMIQAGEDGSYTSDWFNKGVAISVAKYDDKNSIVTDVQIPRREKVAVKDTSKSSGFTYKFVYKDLNDENGPFANPIYSEVAGLTGLSRAEFTERVSQFGRATRTTKSKKNVLTSEEYLKAKMASGVNTDGARSFLELQKELEAI